MNHTDAHGSGDRRRRLEAAHGRHDASDRSTDHQSTHHTMQPVVDRSDSRSLAMIGLIHEELARQRHREAYLQARQARLRRAVRAQRRAARAAEVAARAAERAGADGGYRLAVRALFSGS